MRRVVRSRTCGALSRPPVVPGRLPPVPLVLSSVFVRVLVGFVNGVRTFPRAPPPGPVAGPLCVPPPQDSAALGRVQSSLRSAAMPRAPWGRVLAAPGRVRPGQGPFVGRCVRPRVRPNSKPPPQREGGPDAAAPGGVGAPVFSPAVPDSPSGSPCVPLPRAAPAPRLKCASRRRLRCRYDGGRAQGRDGGRGHSATGGCQSKGSDRGTAPPEARRQRRC